MGKTPIEWVRNADGTQGHSINPIRARTDEGDGHYCEKISTGCANCYASKLQTRFKMPAFGSSNRRDTVEHYLHEKALEGVLRRKRPTTYFWCDMCDLFGDWVEDEWIDACFAVMALTPQHTHQVLTKRAERMRDYVGGDPIARGWQVGKAGDQFEGALPTSNGYFGPTSEWRWPLPNVWLGVSAENQEWADKRIPLLLDTPAAVRFVSAEPLLGAIDFTDIPHRACGSFDALDGRSWDDSAPDGKSCSAMPPIDLVIVGGESGAKARPIYPDWARSIRDQCAAAGVAFFFKQWGAWAPAVRETRPAYRPPFGPPQWRDLGLVDMAAHRGDFAIWTERETWSYDGRPNARPDWHRQVMARVGKKKAGRRLDGVEHNGFPLRCSAHSAVGS